MIRILIADDHGVVAEGLKHLVEAQADMQVVATVGDGRVSFAGFSLPLPPESSPVDTPRDVILGIRPTDLRHAVDAPVDEPRITVEPDLVEELGGVTNVLFPIDAPRVLTDATRAAIEAASDDDATLLADDRRARFCASVASGINSAM